MSNSEKTATDDNITPIASEESESDDEVVPQATLPLSFFSKDKIQPVDEISKNIGITCLYIDFKTMPDVIKYLVTFSKKFDEEKFRFYIGNRYNSLNNYLAKPAKWAQDFKFTVDKETLYSQVLVLCSEYDISLHPEMGLIAKGNASKHCSNKHGKNYKFPVVYVKIYSEESSHIQTIYQIYKNKLVEKKSTASSEKVKDEATDRFLIRATKKNVIESK